MKYTTTHNCLRELPVFHPDSRAFAKYLSKEVRDATSRQQQHETTLYHHANPWWPNQ
jgi:hypothetical protein